MAGPTATLSERAPPRPPPVPRRWPIGWIVAASLFGGATSALVLVLGVFAGAAEHVITGTALLGFAAGWALLAWLSDRRSDEPQPWAGVPATVLALSGMSLLLAAPGEDAMAALGWVWPPVLLGLAVWIGFQARRSLLSRTRDWLVYPVCAVTALTALAGGLETVREAVGTGVPAPAGRLYDVGGHRLYLECSGSGSPTVVLAAGLGEHTAGWAWIAPAVARDTRVCAYDRAGTGRSESAGRPQDGVRAADDLHALLAAGNVPRPYVLVGHSVGGTYDLVFAARFPDEVAGMVLLDSPGPRQFSLPGYPAAHDVGRRIVAVLPSLARLGLGRLVFGRGSAGLPPDACAEERALASGARDLRGRRDEWSQLPATFRQARNLTDLGSKPLLVITAGRGQQRGWSAAQDELAALSTNSLHRIADGATPTALLEDRTYAERFARGIRAVVHAARTGGPLWLRHRG